MTQTEQEAQAWVSRRQARAITETPAPHSLIASAVQIKLPEASRDMWKTFRLRDEQWQMECWRLYDAIGALHFAASWVGSACSRVRIYVAKLDGTGDVGPEVDDDEEIQAIANGLFGGPPAKSEALRAMGIDLTIAGECFIIGRSPRASGDQADKWLIVSPGELRRQGDNLILNFGHGWTETIETGRDIVIRVWTPHPRRIAMADCPTRAALPILLEIERLTKYVFSQLDSRLASAGILPLPAGLEFPRDDGQPAGAEGLMQALTEAASASLSGSGTAAALVPIIVEMPTEAINALKDKPITFESVLSEHARELREDAYQRLAIALDMPPEILTGTGDTNHFNAWHIEEGAVKVHIEPLMTRICDALTKAYLASALKYLGKDPSKYVFWYDTSPLTVRPNRLQDTLNLYKEGLVAGSAVRAAGDYSESVDAPPDKEEQQRFVKSLMERDPTLFQVPAMREFLGIDIDTTVPAAPGVAGAEGDVNAPGPPPPPAPATVAKPEPGKAVPDQPPAPTSSTPILASMVPPPPIPVPAPSAVLVAADAVVLRALELAGGRLLTRGHRDQWQHVPRVDLHTKIKVQSSAHAETLLTRAWDLAPTLFDGLGADSGRMCEVLDNYCKTLLIRSAPHHRALLAAVLANAGVLDE